MQNRSLLHNNYLTMYKFSIERGIRQINTISPKLFTTLLEYMCKKIDWDGMSKNVCHPSLFNNSSTQIL